MRFSTYVFDLDGTLLDTLADLAASCNCALRTHGYPERTLEEVRHFVGNGVRKLIERAVPEGVGAEQVNCVLHTFQDHYLQHQFDTTRPYDGICDMLRSLKSRGCRLAVVSNKFDAATKQLVRHFFGSMIDVAIGENEASGIRRKPAPDTVLAALRQLEASRATAVYVGDSDVDIATAKNCGIPCISVLWGFRDKTFLLSHGASLFAASPEEIVSCSL